MNQTPPIIPRKINNGGMYNQNMNSGNNGNDRHSNQFAMIPQYGESHNEQGSGSGPRRVVKDEG